MLMCAAHFLSVFFFFCTSRCVWSSGPVWEGFIRRDIRLRCKATSSFWHKALLQHLHVRDYRAISINKPYLII